MRLLSCAFVLSFAFLLPTAPASSQTPVTLAGLVSSPEEGAMEGVLVSAKKAGSNHLHHGRERRGGPIQFPRQPPRAGPSRHQHPRHRLRPRRPRTMPTSRRSKTATADLKLRKTEDLAAQMTNAEWANSMPGSSSRRTLLLGLRRLPHPRAHHAIEIHGR